MNWILITAGLVFGAFVAVAAFGMFLLIRAFLRWVIGNEDTTLDRTRPRVRTRIKHTPIETEIADALARDYPQRNHV